MAKTYVNKTVGTDAITKPRQITTAAPFDVRTVVDTYADLLDKNTFSYAEMYVGMMCITVDTQDVYVLSVLPSSRVNATNWPNTIVWKKIGSDETVIDPADNLEYYQEKLGAKVVDSFDELLSAEIEDSFVGMFGVVKINGDSESEEDESGLYVLTRTPNTTASNWYRILGGSGSGSASSGLDVSEVITSDGSTPAAGTGFSISGNDPDALVEETYVDDYLAAGVYYTSKGINSSRGNGGTELEGVDKIRLSNGGESYIELTSDGVMRIYINDDTLGFGAGDISVIDPSGVEYVNPYAQNPLPLNIRNLPLGDGAMIRFDVDVDFTGMIETRDDDPTEYIFGQDGSGYEDLDFYSVNVLPTVYAYADGENVRVLTEGDKDELINKIDELSDDFVPITTSEIQGLF